MRTAKVSLLTLMRDARTFGPWFRNAGTWAAWMVFLKALFNVALEPAEQALYERCTKRTTLPADVSEVWLVVGRRGGKSFILALVAVYVALFINWRPYLTPGEVGTVMIIAADRKQARTIFRYIKAFISAVPALNRMKTRETNDALEFDNSIAIEVQTANFRTVRGYTVVASLLDELAFWRSDTSANPDEEIIAAIRPAMATIPGAIMFCASSPYARRGALWETYNRMFGVEDDETLVWQAPTEVMNPGISQKFLASQRAKDPLKAAAEYDALFRTDVEALVPPDVLEGCREFAIVRRLPQPDTRYRAFVDPSGGTSDSMALAIGHADPVTRLRVVDHVTAVKPPFSPDKVCAEFAALMKKYGITQVQGDAYAGEWPRERFAKHGISYQVCAKPKSELYLDLVPLFNSRQVLLPDLAELRTQFGLLERRTSRTGRDVVDHPRGGHDDWANAVAGVVSMLAAAVEQWGEHELLVGDPLQSAAAWGVSEESGGVDDNYLG